MYSPLLIADPVVRIDADPVCKVNPEFLSGFLEMNEQAALHPSYFSEFPVSDNVQILLIVLRMQVPDDFAYVLVVEGMKNFRRFPVRDTEYQVPDQCNNGRKLFLDRFLFRRVRRSRLLRRCQKQIRRIG